MCSFSKAKKYSKRPPSPSASIPSSALSLESALKTQPSVYPSLPVKPHEGRRGAHAAGGFVSDADEIMFKYHFIACAFHLKI